MSNLRLSDDVMGRLLGVGAKESVCGPPAMVCPSLVFLSGSCKGQCVALPDRGRMRLGRDFSCAIVLSSTLDPVVSAEHAELRTENGRVEITDLASTNGTFVNGQPVKGAQVLEDQDVVELGCPGVRILFVERGAALNAKSIAW